MKPQCVDDTGIIELAPAGLLLSRSLIDGHLSQGALDVPGRDVARR